MSLMERPTRQSVTLPPKIAKRVRALARKRKASANRVIVDLIQERLESVENERRRFLDLADRLCAATDPAERQLLKAELARVTFGE